MTINPIITIPVGARGVDFLKPDPAHTPEWLRANGYTFACRYVARHSKHHKIVTRTEVDHLHACGIAVSLTYEGGDGDVLGGSSAGTANGAFAASFAHDLGYPAGLPLFAAADTDVYAKNLDVATKYMTAFAAALGPYALGIYGDSDILRAMAGLHPIGWLPNAMGWSPSMHGATVHVQQARTDKDHGIDPDECRIPFQAWLPH